jgi:hypothetical protein
MPETPRADLSMPKILDVQIRETTFEPRPLRNFTSSLASARDSVEFIVRTDAPIPIRDLGPALYVGQTPLVEVTQIGPNTYRFVAPTRENLQRDSAIRLSWSGQKPTEEQTAEFRYRLGSQ